MAQGFLIHPRPAGDLLGRLVREKDILRTLKIGLLLIDKEYLNAGNRRCMLYTLATPSRAGSMHGRDPNVGP